MNNRYYIDVKREDGSWITYVVRYDGVKYVVSLNNQIVAIEDTKEDAINTAKNHLVSDY